MSGIIKTSKQPVRRRNAAAKEEFSPNEEIQARNRRNSEAHCRDSGDRVQTQWDRWHGSCRFDGSSRTNPRRFLSALSLKRASVGGILRRRREFGRRKSFLCLL